MILQLSPTPGTPARPLVMDDVVTPLNDALMAQTKLGYMDWWSSRLSDSAAIDAAQYGRSRGRLGREAPVSPKLTQAQAQEQVKRADVDVEVFEGIRQEALNLLIERAREKKRLNETISRADQSFQTRFLLGATAFAVDLADPVNLATSVVPVAGATKVGYLIAKGAARFGPTLTKAAVRAGVGAYEAGVSTAVLEPLNYALHRAVGEKYDVADSAASIGLGAAGGAFLHTSVGASVDIYRSMRARYGLPVDATGRVISDALIQIGRGVPVDLSFKIAQEQAALARGIRRVQQARAGRYPDQALAHVTPEDIARALDRSPTVLEDDGALFVRPKGGARMGSEAGAVPPLKILVQHGGSIPEEPQYRVTRGDILAASEVLRDFLPTSMRRGEDGIATAEYRVKRGRETVLYRRSQNDAGDTAITIYRQRPNQPGHDAPFSKARSPGNPRPEDVANAEEQGNEAPAQGHTPEATATAGSPAEESAVATHDQWQRMETESQNVSRGTVDPANGEASPPVGVGPETSPAQAPGQLDDFEQELVQLEGTKAKSAVTLRGLSDHIRRAMEAVEERFRAPDGSLRATEEGRRWTLAQAKGDAAHKVLEAWIKQHHADKGWNPEAFITGNDGKLHRPDFTTPGYIVELKPWTKSGRQKGRRQKRRYEKQLSRSDKKVIVIYYHPSPPIRTPLLL